MSARATRSAVDRQNLPAAALGRQILACFCCRLARKIVVFHRFPPRPRFCIAGCGASISSTLRVQECFMSFPVNGSNAQNPFALWQSLQQPDSSASTSAQSDPIASLLAALGQGTGTTASPGGASSSSTSGTAGNSSPQFGAQTLQTLFDMQANGTNSQSLASQLGGSGSSDDANSSPQAQQNELGHHHHHPAGGAGGPGGGQNLLDMLGSADSGATSQTAANANGSSTTTITYADGSTVALTTAASSGGSTSSASSNSSAGGANVANNNLLERLIQMQAQLINPTTAQNVATA
jgi:hypothetical protein